MTSEELQAIRDRVKGASDGPWAVRRIPNSYESQAGDRFTHPCVRGFRVPRRLYNLAWEQCEVDAEFMASARQDVPSLIGEVEHLQSILQDCHAAIGELLERKGPISGEDLATIVQFMAEEEAHWSGEKKPAEVRRLFMTQARIRPKERKAG